MRRLPLVLGALAAGCADPSPERGTIVEPLAGWTEQMLDITALTPIPPGGIPTPRTPLSAFTIANTAQQLLTTDESFTMLPAPAPGDVIAESTGWAIHQRGGALVAIATTPSGPPIAVSPPALLADARARLAAFGLADGEIGAIHQSELRWQDRDANRTLGAVQGGVWKTFVERTVLGVPIAGHRAVITHGVDGELRKALVIWPALAASGHRLHTTDTVAQIKSNAVAALDASNLPPSTAILAWSYVAAAQPSGEVTLTLVVTADVPASSLESDEIQELGEQVTVAVTAMP